jgi:hypothetical protein
MIAHRILLFALISSCFFASGQKLISYEHVDTYSKDDLVALWEENNVPQFISPVNYGVEVYELIYWTVWHDGSPIKASGLYYVPVEVKTDLPLAAYNHGSQSKRRTKVELAGEGIIATALAADGYAACLPDYVGLGKGDKFHLYHHAETEALSTIDMIRAVRELNPQIGVGLSDFLFLGGYSQGGHASMATHKYIEDHFPEEFQVTASAPMSGAYDLGGVQEKKMFVGYDKGAYLPYLMWGYNEVYGWYESLEEVLREDVADTVMAMFYSQKYTLGTISKLLPGVPAEAVRPEFVEAYRDNPEDPFRLALKENSLTEWAPQNPMLICYCEADEQVNYENSLLAYDRMRELGSKTVKLRHAGKHFDHRTCALYTNVYAKMYFDSFLKGSEKGRKGPVLKRFMLSLGKIGPSKKARKKNRVAEKESKE